MFPLVGDESKRIVAAIISSELDQMGRHVRGVSGVARRLGSAEDVSDDGGRRDAGEGAQVCEIVNSADHGLEDGEEEPELILGCRRRVLDSQGDLVLVTGTYKFVSVCFAEFHL